MKIESKETIRKAALDIIAYEGIDKLTMSSLAKDSGITKATLYYWYESKEAIIEDIYIEGHKSIIKKGFKLSLKGTIDEVLLNASKKWESIFLDDELAPYLRMIFSLYLIDERARDEHNSLILMLKSQSDVIINSFEGEGIKRNQEMLSSLFSSLLLSNLEKVLLEDEIELDKTIKEFSRLLGEFKL